MSDSAKTDERPAATLNSLCERFHQWLDGIFTYYNTEFWKQTTKVRPRRYCKERGLPSKKGDKVDKDYVVVEVGEGERWLEQKYLRGYANGAGKRRCVDTMV